MRRARKPPWHIQFDVKAAEIADGSPTSMWLELGTKKSCICALILWTNLLFVLNLGCATSNSNRFEPYAPLARLVALRTSHVYYCRSEHLARAADAYYVPYTLHRSPSLGCLRVEREDVLAVPD